MFTENINFKESKEMVLKAVDTITDPIAKTISPKGANVLFQDENGFPFVTNDGATIAKGINPENEIERVIVDIIKTASLKTNHIAGDGTSTSVLLSSKLIKGGIKLLEDGINPMDIKRNYENFRDNIITQLKKQKRIIKTKKDKMYIATISCNNDEKLAKDVVEVVECVGDDGLVFIEQSKTNETYIRFDTGFIVNGGIQSNSFANQVNGTAFYSGNIPMLITSQKIYHQEEAEAIIRFCLDQDWKDVVIVAPKFIGKSADMFLANHKSEKVPINILLITDSNSETNQDTLDDLIIYTGGSLFTEQRGKFVDNLTEDDFTFINHITCDKDKSIISLLNKNEKKVKKHVEVLKTEHRKSEDKLLKNRIASLTNGMVTIFVGGNTPLEQRELIYRYEDGINALRSAIKDGYLLGGGKALLEAYRNIKEYKDNNNEFTDIFSEFSFANITQILSNCGVDKDIYNEALSDKGKGYNALTGKICDLYEDGIIDPYKVTEQSVINSVSVANVILTSVINTIIINYNLED